MADLATAVGAAMPSDNTVRVGTVASVSGSAVGLLVGGVTLDRVSYLGDYSPVVGDVVAAVRQGAAWLILGRVVGAEAVSPPSLGLGVVGAKFTTAGSYATPVGAAEGVVPAWGAGSTSEVVFKPGRLYQIFTQLTIFTTTGTTHGTVVRVRKSVNSTTAGVLLQWNTEYAMVGNGVTKQHYGYVKNTATTEIAATLGLTSQRFAGSGNITMYADANLPTYVVVHDVGSVGMSPGLAAMASVVPTA